MASTSLLLRSRGRRPSLATYAQPGLQSADQIINLVPSVAFMLQLNDDLGTLLPEFGVARRPPLLLRFGLRVGRILVARMQYHVLQFHSVGLRPPRLLLLESKASPEFSSDAAELTQAASDSVFLLVLLLRPLFLLDPCLLRPSFPLFPLYTLLLLSPLLLRPEF